MSRGNKTFEDALLTVVRQELPEEILVFEECIAHLRWMDAAECVHKIKHKISLLGMEEAFLRAEEYENQLKKGESFGEVEFRKLLDSMKTFLEL
ncbi:Hpt domain-containing protein [Reichenbachiella sp. 5M10]|uniref:Hpt domain-containing protein n=1 Tax=Reichenbachiella sp. 5M10 TaxID=1889772 RepID=UPI00117A6EE0|nr:Hpt domain-containing protein [Reichenbachiella sp. 5M10]